ncbi:TetR/AcrR family transcriptional regulator [Rhodococcus sp. IEGM1428]|uniref:TetR/AcrR family transcriptional regulator n=1 Tax=Rhodococcus sp. IEGM1428 TaxID=3392191 RepID=UPI003D0AAEB4
MDTAAPTRKTLSERRGEELRLTIALTARDLFVAEESTSVTVERICDAVGINPRTFHRHFPVKEDVIRPLLRRSESVIIEALARTSPDADPIETLVMIFTTELVQNSILHNDYRFMTLIVTNAPYRLRWQEWDEELCAPITEFLSTRLHLSSDPFLRNLPATLAIQTARQALIYWVRGGTEDLDKLEDVLRGGMTALFSGYG